MFSLLISTELLVSWTSTVLLAYARRMTQQGHPDICWEEWIWDSCWWGNVEITLASLLMSGLTESEPSLLGLISESSNTCLNRSFYCSIIHCTKSLAIPQVCPRQEGDWYTSVAYQWPEWVGLWDPGSERSRQYFFLYGWFFETGSPCATFAGLWLYM